MKKAFIKILMFILVFSLAMTSFAFAIEAGTDPSVGAEDSDSGAVGKINISGQKIVNAITWFGYAISLVMIIIVGIRYILGAAEARATMKKAVVSWLIGAFIVFMASTIMNWVFSAFVLGDDNTLAHSILEAASGSK